MLANKGFFVLVVLVLGTYLTPSAIGAPHVGDLQVRSQPQVYYGKYQTEALDKRELGNFASKVGGSAQSSDKLALKLEDSIQSANSLASKVKGSTYRAPVRSYNDPDGVELDPFETDASGKAVWTQIMLGNKDYSSLTNFQRGALKRYYWGFFGKTREFYKERLFDNDAGGEFRDIRLAMQKWKEEEDKGQLSKERLVFFRNYVLYRQIDALERFILDHEGGKEVLNPDGPEDVQDLKRHVQQLQTALKEAKSAQEEALNELRRLKKHKAERPSQWWSKFFP